MIVIINGRASDNSILLTAIPIPKIALFKPHSLHRSVASEPINDIPTPFNMYGIYSPNVFQLLPRDFKYDITGVIVIIACTHIITQNIDDKAGTMVDFNSFNINVLTHNINEDAKII